jgi:hypothetical protein
MKTDIHELTLELQSLTAKNHELQDKLNSLQNENQTLVFDKHNNENVFSNTLSELDNVRLELLALKKADLIEPFSLKKESMIWKQLFNKKTGNPMILELKSTKKARK